MELWFLIVISTLCIAALLKSLLTLLLASSYTNLPPGPPLVPIVGNSAWLHKTISDLESIVLGLKSKYGPIITLRIGYRPSIFVTSHAIAHRALVQNGAVFSDRPKAFPTAEVFNSHYHTIASASYGSTWRLLRRNLTSEILHPSRVKSYTRARNWVLEILINCLKESSHGGETAVTLMNHFQYTMFALLVLMCLGDRLEEKQIKQIEGVTREMLLSGRRFGVLNFWPTLGKFLFCNRWNELFQLRKKQEDVLIPLIRSRIEFLNWKKKKQQPLGDDNEQEDYVLGYVDTLVDLELPEEKRKLTECEMVSLCSEFLTAGTDTTSTALQWIMANLVKYPTVQAKLYGEITGIVGPPEAEVKISEDDVQKMPYLKAVVLEGLRRHPPGHMLLPHKVSENTELEGYTVPKTGTINFMVADMGLDPKVWDEPMEFKPERFLSGNVSCGVMVPVFDIMGSKEIKMMPFGAGRRACPGFGLAILHLEYFVANLVWYFQWTAGDEGVDLAEKQEFTVVMKNALRAHIHTRV